MPPANHTTCATSSSPLCISCSARDNCNIETVRTDETCLVCNSALDPNCAQRPGLVKAEHCAIPSDGQCFSRVINGATARGCKGSLLAADLPQCTNNTQSSLCSITTGQSSNNVIIPRIRFTCYHCDSRVDASCAETPTNSTESLPCKKYSPPESCLKLKTSDGASKLKKVFCKLMTNKTSRSFQSSEDASLISAQKFASKARVLLATTRKTATAHQYDQSALQA
jgi:Protein of unknown function (DUF753)